MRSDACGPLGPAITHPAHVPVARGGRRAGQRLPASRRRTGIRGVRGPRVFATCRPRASGASGSGARPSRPGQFHHSPSVSRRPTWLGWGLLCPRDVDNESKSSLLGRAPCWKRRGRPCSRLRASVCLAVTCSSGHESPGGKDCGRIIRWKMLLQSRRPNFEGARGELSPRR